MVLDQRRIDDQRLPSAPAVQEEDGEHLPRAGVFPVGDLVTGV